MWLPVMGHVRVLGGSGLTVGAIGLGCWAIGGPFWSDGQPLGWGDVDDEESVRAIRRALALGVTFFDTAAVYGPGPSQPVLRRAPAGRPDDPVVPTPPRPTPPRPAAASTPASTPESHPPRPATALAPARLSPPCTRPTRELPGASGPPRSVRFGHPRGLGAVFVLGIPCGGYAGLLSRGAERVLPPLTVSLLLVISLGAFTSSGYVAPIVGGTIGLTLHLGFLRFVRRHTDETNVARERPKEDGLAC